jgi:CheY-like chemotaxis protein
MALLANVAITRRDQGMDDTPKGKKKKLIDDWMVRISFAEAGEPDMGLKSTGIEPFRKSQFALEKIMVVRDEKMAGDAENERKDMETVSQRGKQKESGGDKLNVMILDDEPIVIKRLQPALVRSGFDVESFEKPTKAIARLNEKDFDIVVTDLRMEEISGIQILEHIMENCKNTRVILITGYATVEVAREALVKGAFDFIAKPFKPKDLKTVINKAALSLGHKAIA